MTHYGRRGEQRSKPPGSRWRPPSLEPDEATVRQFLEIISAQTMRATSGMANPGFLQMDRMHPMSTRGGPVSTRYAIGNVEEMVKAALADAAAGHNVWIEARTVLFGQAGGRGKVEDSVAVFALVVDSDADKDRTGQLDIQASLTVETSRENRHFWLFLDKAIPPADAQEIGDRIRANVGADNDTGTVTQPYRVAGTPNFPNKEKRARGRVTAEPTRIIEHSGKLWTADDLRKHVPPVRRRQAGNGGSARPTGEADLPPDLLKIIREGVQPPKDRSAHFHSVVGWLRRLGWTLDGIITLLSKYPDGIASKYSGRVREEVERSYGKVSADPELEELNERYAVVTIGGSVRVMTLTCDPVFYRITDFRTLLLNRVKQISVSPPKSVPLATWWLSHPQRRQYAGVVFEPGEPETIRGNRNLWTGFAAEPRQGDCSRYLAFLYDIICSGDEAHYNYLLNVMADAVQRPNKQGNVAIVTRGKEGVGKGFAANTFGRLFGRHFLPVTQASHVTGKFNAHLAYCSVLFCDEAFFAGDRQHESTLKGLITEPVFMIERKGIDAVAARNLTHIWISSNENWVVPAGPTARRFFCLDVSDARRNDLGYFAAIDSQIREGGSEALLYMLLNRDLCDVDIRNIPETTVLAEQKALTRRGVDALVEWLANEGILPCADTFYPYIAITCDHSLKETVYDVVRRRIPGLQYKTPTSLTRALKKEWGCIT